MEILVKHRSGSHAYGTNIESSDEDYRGLFSADEKSIRTPFFTVREIEDSTEEDTKYYELTNFFKLLIQMNPNIMETLWVDESDIIINSDVYKYFRQYREELISSKAHFSYCGYSFAQLKRIKGHNKHINNPQPEIPPHQKDYITLVHNFTHDKIFKIDLNQYNNGYRLIPYATNIYGIYQLEGYNTFNENGLNTTYEGDSHIHQNPLFIIKFNKEVYEEHKLKHTQYWEWKKNRNKTRSELEEKYLYDTKHAMHLIRLLKTSIEILQTGQVIVKRPDAKELLDIRNGCMTYDELIKYAESLELKSKELYKTTKLRHHVDVNFASKLLMELQDMCWKK